MQDSGVRKFLGFVSVLKEILNAKDGFLILQVFFTDSVRDAIASWQMNFLRLGFPNN